MFNSLVNVFKNNELRNKILFAIIVILLCRIAADLFRFFESESNKTSTGDMSSSESIFCEGRMFQPSIGDYFSGNTSQHELEYLDWLSAATNGNEWAQCRMGDFWFTGAAGYPNHCEALKWWLASSEQGNLVAKYRLIKYYFLESFEQWCKPRPFLHSLFF